MAVEVNQYLLSEEKNQTGVTRTGSNLTNVRVCRQQQQPKIRMMTNCILELLEKASKLFLCRITAQLKSSIIKS
jgi:hypothetical protein